MNSNFFGSSEDLIINDFMYGSNVANSQVKIRLGFIRKVYGILSVQLGLTTSVGIMMMSNPIFTQYIKSK